MSGMSELAPASRRHGRGPGPFRERLAGPAPAFEVGEGTFYTLGFGPLRTAWLSHAARLGETIRARTGAETREGVFETIDSAGNLILRMTQGPVAIPAAEVFF